MAKCSSYIVLDFETGGLDATIAAITECAAIGFAGDSFIETGRVNRLVTPYDKDYNPKALEVTGITLSLLEDEGVDIKQVATEFVELMKNTYLYPKVKNAKSILIAHNALFDISFLRQLLGFVGSPDELMSKYLDGAVDPHTKHFLPRYIDSMNLGKQAFGQDAEKLKDWKLGTIIENAGVELIDAHRAMNDVEATKDVFVELTNRMRNNSSQGSSVSTGKSRYRDHFKFGPIKINE